MPSGPEGANVEPAPAPGAPSEGSGGSTVPAPSALYQSPVRRRTISLKVRVLDSLLHMQERAQAPADRGVPP